jgi:8-amino-3,8-dideoxy-alpha-D-manno-octulosonate transaminase
LMQAAVAEMKEKGIYGGSFHYYDNNWHYIRNWQHLKEAETLNGLPHNVAQALRELADKEFPISDSIIGRSVSTLINLSWTDEQIKEKGEKMVAAIKKALDAQLVNA